MRKEILFAIIAGGIFGLVIAFGVWRINSSLSSKNENKTVDSNTQQPPSEIAIAQPSENDVITSSPTEINGVTKSSALVAISAEEKDYLVLADNKGAFSQEVALVGGVNQLVLTSFGTDNAMSQQILNLIYSTEFAKLVGTPTPTPSKDESSTDSIRLRVQEKVNEALNSPTAYTGTITDIAESTIQLKAKTGEIQQVSTREEPSVIKDGKAPKEVKLTDIAIGDFIVAMGFTNGNHVLYARRILITSPTPKTERKAIRGLVSEATTKSITLALTGGVNIEVTPISGALVYKLDQDTLAKIKFSSVSSNDEVIALGEQSDDTFKARTVFVTNSQ
jgi:hypothetical protein